TLLHDLLDEQINHKNGSIEEYQQIKRLVRSLVSNEQLDDEQLLQLLPEIYNYGIRGEIAQSLPDHMMDNKDNIETWKDVIQNTDVKELTVRHHLMHAILINVHLPYMFHCAKHATTYDQVCLQLNTNTCAE